MARTMRDHLDDADKQKRELRRSEGRINDACSRLGTDEAREKTDREFKRQRALLREARESMQEQIDRG